MGTSNVVINVVDVIQHSTYGGETPAGSNIHLLAANSKGFFNFRIPQEHRQKRFIKAFFNCKIDLTVLPQSGYATIKLVSPANYNDAIDILTMHSAGSFSPSVEITNAKLHERLYIDDRIAIEIFPTDHRGSAEGYVTNPPTCTIVFEDVVVTTTAASPIGSARIFKTIANQFRWGLSYSSAKVKDPITQISAKLRIRAAGASQYLEYYIPSADKVFTLPANTINDDTIQWQVETTSSNGYVSTTGWQSVSTVDYLSNAISISPTSDILEDADGVLFKWTHSISSGTATTGFILEYSQNSGASWVVFANKDDAVTQYKSNNKDLPFGTIMWRVATKNGDGKAGNYSEPKTFILLGAPEIPSVTFFSDSPAFPTFKWQAIGQEGYQVKISNFDSGTIYGTDKEIIVPLVLSDGIHVFAIRVINNQNKWSEWCYYSVEIKNIEQPKIELVVNTSNCDAKLSWSTEGEYTQYQIWRNNQLIDTISKSSFIDFFSNGKNIYKIRGISQNGFYGTSQAAVVIIKIPYALITSINNINWQLLKFKVGSPPQHSSSSSPGVEMVFYQGRKSPVCFVDGTKTRSHNFSYTVKTMEQYHKLEELSGKIVVFKNNAGDVIIGVMGAINCERAAKYYDVSFDITEIDLSEVKAL